MERAAHRYRRIGCRERTRQFNQRNASFLSGIGTPSTVNDIHSLTKCVGEQS